MRTLGISGVGFTAVAAAVQAAVSSFAYWNDSTIWQDATIWTE